jgi:hypothetical protein
METKSIICFGAVRHGKPVQKLHDHNVEEYVRAIQKLHDHNVEEYVRED